MDALRSTPSALAALLLAVGAGLGFLEPNVRSITFCWFVLFTCLWWKLPERAFQWIWTASLLLILAIFLWDALVLGFYGHAGVEISKVFAIMGIIIASGYVYENVLKERKDKDDWIPIRPGPAAGLRLQNMRNRAISNILNEKMERLVAKKRKILLLQKRCGTELEKVKKVITAASDGSETSGQGSSGELQTLVEHYGDLLELNLKEAGPRLEILDTEIQALDRKLQEHVQSDINLNWR